MPEITSETPREQYTIAGQTFNVFQPYAEGHTLTSGEASALNQTYAENIRNNFASKVKEAVEAGAFDQEVFQGQLDDYMSDYEFGVRRGGGGRTGDPVMAEALIIARDKVRVNLKKKGYQLKDVPASEITRLAKDVIASGKYPEIMQAAEARVAAQRDIADIEIGEPNLDAGNEAEAEAEAGTEEKRGRKNAAE